MGILSCMEGNPYRVAGAGPSLPKQPKPRASFLRVLGWLTVAASVLVTIATWARCLSDVRWAFGDPCAQSLSRVVSQIERAGGYAGWIGVVAFLRWVYGAARNVDRAGRKLSHSPVQCVLWFVIPIAQLVMGYRVTSEIAAASDLANPTKAQSSIFVWWVSWCASWILGLVRAYAARKSPGDAAVFRHGIVLEIAASIFLTVALVSLASFIDAIARCQERLRVDTR